MEKIKILTENKILRLKIDKNWTSDDFINIFNSLNLIYEILLELEFIDDEVEFLKKYKKENNLSESIKLKDQGFEFEILNDIQIIDGKLYKKLNYASISNNSLLIKDFSQNFTKKLLINDRTPNNLLKVSKIKFASPGFADFVGLGKIVEQVFDIVKYYFPNKENDLKNSLLEQDLITKKIDNLKSIGYSKKDIQKILNVRDSSILNIKNLKLSNKITKIEIKEIE